MAKRLQIAGKNYQQKQNQNLSFFKSLYAAIKPAHS